MTEDHTGSTRFRLSQEKHVVGSPHFCVQRWHDRLECWLTIIGTQTTSLATAQAAYQNACGHGLIATKVLEESDVSGI